MHGVPYDVVEEKDEDAPGLRWAVICRHGDPIAWFLEDCLEEAKVLVRASLALHTGTMTSHIFYLNGRKEEITCNQP